MKKLLAFLLVAVMAATCLALTLSVSAEGASVTATVTQGEANFAEDKLAKLVDGDRDLGATAFGSAGLISFQNKNFWGENGPREDAGSVTVEITVDLGESKAISSVYLDFFRDDNDTTGSFISLPSAVEVAVSADGEDYGDASAATIPEGIDLKVNTITVDFSDDVDVRYIKATVTFDNEWIFMSEIGVNEADEGDDDSTETTGETTETTDETENTETTDETENTESTETTDETENTESTETTDETENTESTETTDETENTESTETTDDVENTESAETTDDVESTETTDDAVSTESTESSAPASSDAPVPSDANSSSDAPITGDTGMILFVVLGVVAIAGAAVAVKVRG